jgi:glycerol kinase
MDKFILAIDQGTTGTTVCVLNREARMLASVNFEHPQIYPQPGWVEHDPEMIWKTVADGIQQALNKAGISGSQIAGIGITNQRETVVLWDHISGKPLHNAIVWQCRRTTDFCNKIKKTRVAAVIKKKTGLVVDPYFSGSKIRWLLDNVKGARAAARNGDVRVGTIDSFLLWRLSGGTAHKTDVSNASRTQLMNIQTGAWDQELLKIFNVPAGILPEIAPSSGVFGATKGVAGVPDGVPIAGIAGDQQSALFGQACFEPGMAKCTFGTGSFLLMNTGAKMVGSKSGLLTTVAWQLSGQKKLTYALEGGAFICGAAVQWLRDEMKFISASSEVQALAEQVQDSGGVYLVPAFVGLGAPYWDPDARGAIVGMTRGSGRPQLARATLEAMALQNVDILVAMEKDLGRRMRTVRVDGGAVQNDLLMQMQSDFLGVNVERPKQTESTVLGAAFLAGLGVGFWGGLDEIKKVWALDREFKPALKGRERSVKMKEWHQAVSRVRGTLGHVHSR